VSGLKDEELIKKQTYTITKAYNLYSGVFWIFLPNVIGIGPYNFGLYRFKVCTFFLRHSVVCLEMSLISYVSTFEHSEVERREVNIWSFVESCHDRLVSVCHQGECRWWFCTTSSVRWIQDVWTRTWIVSNRLCLFCRRHKSGNNFLVGGAKIEQLFSLGSKNWWKTIKTI